jgi:Family of unknown function (DUF6056)
VKFRVIRVFGSWFLYLGVQHKHFMPSPFIAFLNNRRFLLFIICIFILPFFLLSAWNHPSLDDFTLGIFRTENSFWQTQSHFYLHWSGRYMATFIASLCVTGGILYTHYYLFAAILLVCTFLGFLFTLRELNSYFLEKRFSSFSLFIIAGLLLILELHVIPEIKTQFYWFSSSLTYQVPLILLVLVIGLLFRFLSRRGNRTLILVLIFILVFLLNGFNEIFSLLVLVFSFFWLAWYFYTFKFRFSVFLLLWIWNLLSVCVMFLSPGNLERRSFFSARSVVVSAGTGVVKFLTVNWYFLKEPLWWLMALSIFLWSMKHPLRHEGKLIQSLKRTSIQKLIGLYLLLGVLVYVPMLIASNGSLPPRAENAISFLFSLLILFCIHLKAPDSGQSPAGFSSSWFFTCIPLLFSIFIFTSSQSPKVVQSLVSGYFYHQVMEEREEHLEQASKGNEIVVTIDDYDLSLKKKMEEVFPGRVPQTLRKMIEEKPNLLYMQDYLGNEAVLRKIYGLKQVIINQPGKTQ